MCEVLQGLVLDPPISLIYINDLCNVSSTLDLLLFADDTNYNFSHGNTEAFSPMQIMN